MNIVPWSVWESRFWQSLGLFFCGGFQVWKIYAVGSVCENAIWFVLGMEIAFLGSESLRKKYKFGYTLAAIFLTASIFTYKINNELIAFLMGLLACLATIMIMMECRSNRRLDYFRKYTMPIFLMHTLVAAPLRILLLKVGISNPNAHIVIGLSAGFIGPVIAMNVLEKIKLDWIVYPSRSRIFSRASG